MNKFLEFLHEASEEEFKTLLDKALTLKTEIIKQDKVWVNDQGKKVLININQDNYVQSDMDGKVLNTQKLYKDGNITNYDLGIKRLKQFLTAVQNEQIIKQKKEF